jgi:hypothetical protein
MTASGGKHFSYSQPITGVKPALTFDAVLLAGALRRSVGLQ